VVRERGRALVCIADGRTCFVHDDARRTDMDEGRRSGFLGCGQKSGCAVYIGAEEWLPGSGESK
jgi:hypothetical protein